LTEVHAIAADGSPLRSWLVLPTGASPTSPAPLLLWVHGGPLGSWNAWQWRWNPWLLAARGYAVLLPDPALSTGYGLGFVARGWGRWGEAPYTDVLALTDAAVARPDLDGERTAAMGGSFGGYMANWIAGHTDRFRAIVTHASLWALDQFGPTTDASFYWRREMAPAMTEHHSPHRSVDAISTPMLVIHGDKDYRVPVVEALRLWWDLVSRHRGDPADLPHRFLYYPDENHWILNPQNAAVWYETVTAVLDHHVLGRPWTVPPLVR
jgi:dipeptidyl aminopeptidase/acylaminoacyl peptidase